MTTNVVGQSKSPGPVLFWGEMYLRRMREEWPNERLAVVFDIDDTALVDSPQRPMPEFERLYHLARDLKYSIFFVTARVDMQDNTALTKQQLLENGFGHFDDLFMMPAEYLPHPNFSLYKYKMRQALHDSGYNIVLNAGDTWHDLMLLPPWQTRASHIAKINQLMDSVPRKDYIIFQPPDLAWMAVKFPERFHPASASDLLV